MNGSNLIAYRSPEPLTSNRMGRNFVEFFDNSRTVLDKIKMERCFNLSFLVDQLGEFSNQFIKDL